MQTYTVLAPTPRWRQFEEFRKEVGRIKRMRGPAQQPSRPRFRKRQARMPGANPAHRMGGLSRDGARVRVSGPRSRTSRRLSRPSGAAGANPARPSSGSWEPVTRACATAWPADTAACAARNAGRLSARAVPRRTNGTMRAFRRPALLRPRVRRARACAQRGGAARGSGGAAPDAPPSMRRWSVGCSVGCAWCQRVRDRMRRAWSASDAAATVPVRNKM